MRQKFFKTIKIPESIFSDNIHSGECGENVTWHFTEEGVLWIEGTGEMEETRTQIPWDKRKDEIHRVVLAEGITSICNNAFAECENLQDIIIPKSVLKIGEAAFEDCIKLKSFEIPENITTIERYTFFQCSCFKDLILPDCINRIEEGAFCRCTNMNDIKIPAHVNYIGSYAFAECWNMTNITVADENTEYSSKDGSLYDKTGTILLQCPAGKKGKYIVPPGVIEIGKGAFSGCIYLTEIILPDSVKDIGEGAFSECSSLEHITLPEKIVEIKDETFAWCSGLKQMQIPVGVTHIGDGAFEECSALEDIIFSDHLTHIGDGAFSGCLRLTALTFSKQVICIGEEAFERCYYLKDIFYEGTREEWEMINCNDGIIRGYVAIHYQWDSNIRKKENYKWSEFCSIFWAIKRRLIFFQDILRLRQDIFCTRAQVVNYIWLVCGAQEFGGQENIFFDVEPEHQYYKSILWAVENGIIDNNKPFFRPEDLCTRGQALLFIWQMAKDETPLNRDIQINNIYEAKQCYYAFMWAVNEGILQNVSFDEFNSQAPCSFRQIVLFLYRLMEKRKP